jgi:hypothetical protein
MCTNPKKNQIDANPVLIEQFRRKGYKCEEVKEKDATVFIITHEKKNTELITHVMNDAYKNLLKAD